MSMYFVLIYKIILNTKKMGQSWKLLNRYKQTAQIHLAFKSYTIFATEKIYVVKSYTVFVIEKYMLLNHIPYL